MGTRRGDARGTCEVCGRRLFLRKDGTVRLHKGRPRGRWGDRTCPGAGQRPRRELFDQGG